MAQNSVFCGDTKAWMSNSRHEYYLFIAGDTEGPSQPRARGPRVSSTGSWSQINHLT